MTVDSSPKSLSQAGLVRIGEVARALGISVSWVRFLADNNVLPSARSKGGHRYFDLDAVREAWERNTVESPDVPVQAPAQTLFSEDLKLDGLLEHLVWERVEPLLGLDSQSPAFGVAHYALTEMLNNAIDHSGGAVAKVRIIERGDDLIFDVIDDGEGAFEHLRNNLGLPDTESALLEMSKGKRTTDPARHSGEGIFFTSKAVAFFELEANGMVWLVDNERGEQAVGESSILKGTRVGFRISRSGVSEIGDLFHEFTDEEFRFTRSRPSVKLAEIGTEFVSRSEAKRLLAGMERFKEIEIDFAGVTRVGQGFADEAFRVWPSNHPEVRVVPVNMIPMVEFMVRRSADFGRDHRPHRPDHRRY